MSGRYEHAKEVVGPGGHVGGQCGMCKQTVAQVDGKKSKGWVVTMCRVSATSGASAHSLRGAGGAVSSRASTASGSRLFSLHAWASVFFPPQQKSIPSFEKTRLRLG